MSKLSLKKFSSLFSFFVLIFVIQWVGYQFTVTSVGNWYLTLQKPAWNPPSWVFAPVWTILYVMIAISGWLIYVKVHPCAKRRLAFTSYGLQLFFNLLWSFFFFFLKSPGLALIDLFLLVAMISLNVALFAKLYRPAALLLIPYLVWTLFAAALNFAIWMMNGIGFSFSSPAI